MENKTEKYFYKRKIKNPKCIENYVLSTKVIKKSTILSIPLILYEKYFYKRKIKNPKCIENYVLSTKVIKKSTILSIPLILCLKMHKYIQNISM